jgi:transformation/transcription domain-associated protein
MVFNLLVHNKILVLQILLTEIGSRFVTLPEERLLAVVNALLHRCYKYPTATTGEVPQSLKKELSGVCRACFSADAVNKHVDFVRDYKQDFERDLDPESTATFPATLSELTARLKHWKNVLQSNVEDRFPTVLKLEEESRVLRDFHVVDVEVPGQYFCDQVIEPHLTYINFCDVSLLYILEFLYLVWVNRSGN